MNQLLRSCGRAVAPLALLVLSAGCVSARNAPGGDGAPVLSRIAFGSCSDQDRPQPLWPHVRAARPDLWVWLGDNVYADTTDPEVIRATYARAKADPGYAALRSATPVIGTWDDHDYGLNDGGREFSARRESQQALLDFFDVPADSPRRNREGVYEAYTYGPPGRQVKVLLLDTRFHRDPLGSGGDVLGAEQWAWLERELRTSSAQVHLIGSSIQVVAEDHRFEKWANFPAARERLFRLVGETRAPGVVFISGDRHIAEVSRADRTTAGYPLYDVTASGMTHTWSEDRPEENRHRVGDKVVALNFGLLEIDWEAGALRFQIRDEAGRTRREEVVPLALLQPPTR